MKNKLIVLGPGRDTRGGITSVIKAHQSSNNWSKWNCIWIETYIDKGSIQKIFFFLKSYFQFIVNIPSAKLVHIHLSEPMSAFRKSFYFNLAYLLKKKIIIHLHAFSPDTSLNGSKKNLYYNMFLRADGVIALSNYWKTQIEDLIGSSNKIKIIYNPCPKVKIDSSIEKEKIILFAGTLNKRKGYKDLIEGFGLIANKYKDWKIIFAGNGELEKAELYAKKFNVFNQIIFKGWISGNEKDNLFKKSSIFCLPSYAEGFPMAVLDAWAYGIPVITTPVGGLPEIIKHKENAMVFNAGDINELSRNIEDLITQVDLRRKISDESLLLSQRTFSVEKTCSDLDIFYKQFSSV